MHRISGLLCLGALAAILAGCGTKKDDYKLGEAAYARGNYQASANIFEGHTGAFDPRKDEAKFYSGMSKLNVGDTDSALADFKDVASSASSHTLRARALDAQGKAYLKSNNPGEAEAAYNKILKDYAKDYPEEDALGGLLKAKTAKGDTVGAAKVRQELAGKYPHSPYLGKTAGAAPAGLALKQQSGALYKVRLNKIYADHAAAKAEAVRLQRKGLEAIPVALAQGRYGVQVGAFASPDNARGRVDSLRAYGYPAAIVNNG